VLERATKLQRLLASGIIAVIRRVPEEAVEEVAQSLINGGVSALEITVDSPSAFSIISKLSQKFKDTAIVGAGTVLDGESARKAIESGAEFLLSPILRKDVIVTASRYGKISVPGVMTPTEIITAIEWGADLVKIFPASTIGVQFIKDIKNVFPHIGLIPTGGVNLENVSLFIKAGASAVGVGGNLVDGNAIKTSNFAKIEQTARAYIDAVAKARQ